MNKIVKKLLVALLFCVTVVSFASCSFTPTINEVLCSHENSVGRITKEATCDEYGVFTITCKDCGYENKERIAKLKHSPVIINEIIATCTDDGLSEGSYCSLCGTVLKEQKVIPATGHLLEMIEGVAATCVSEGLTEGLRCSFCSETFFEQELIPIDNNAHIFNEYGSNEDGHWTICGECGYEGESVAHAGEWKTVGEVGKDIKDVLTCECGKVMNTVYLANVDAEGKEIVVELDLSTTKSVNLMLILGETVVNQTGTTGIAGLFFNDELVMTMEEIAANEFMIPATIFGDATGEQILEFGLYTGLEADGDLLRHDVMIKFNIVKTSTEDYIETAVTVGEFAAGNWYRLYYTKSGLDTVCRIEFSNGTSRFAIGKINSSYIGLTQYQDDEIIDHEDFSAFNTIEGTKNGDAYIDFYIREGLTWEGFTIDDTVVVSAKYDVYRLVASNVA